MRYQTHLLRKYNCFLQKLLNQHLLSFEYDKYRARIFDIKKQLQAVNSEDMTDTAFQYYINCCDIIAHLEAYYG